MGSWIVRRLAVSSIARLDGSELTSDDEQDNVGKPSKKSPSQNKHEVPTDWTQSVPPVADEQVDQADEREEEHKGTKIVRRRSPALVCIGCDPRGYATAKD